MTKVVATNLTHCLARLSSGAMDFIQHQNLTSLPSRQSDVHLLHGAQSLLGVPFHICRRPEGRPDRRVPVSMMKMIDMIEVDYGIKAIKGFRTTVQ